MECNETQLVLMHKYMFNFSDPEQLCSIFSLMNGVQNVYNWLDIPNFYTIIDYLDSISQCEISKLDKDDELNWLGFGLVDIVKSNLEHIHIMFSMNGNMRQILNLRLISPVVEIKKISEKAYFILDKVSCSTYFLVLPIACKVLSDCSLLCTGNNSPLSSESSSGLQFLAQTPRTQYQEMLKQYFFVGLHDETGIKCQSYICRITPILNSIHSRLEFQFKNLVPFLLYGPNIENLSLPLKSLTIVRVSRKLILLLKVANSVLFFWFCFKEGIDTFLQFLAAYSTLLKNDSQNLPMEYEYVFRYLAIGMERTEVYNFVKVK